MENYMNNRRVFSFGILIAAIVAGTTFTDIEAKSNAQSKSDGLHQYQSGEFRNIIADIAEDVVPSVVAIKSAKIVEYSNSYDRFFDEFFFGHQRRGQQPSRKERREGIGSGVIVSDKGYILTNNHVVEGADELIVVLDDDREFKAEIVGTDKLTDLAVVKFIDVPKNLPVARLGDSDKLRIGDWVVAIGSPFGLNHTVTKGIVSAKEIHGRGISSYENFIQTDAAINPGNSGGALLNLNGELVGINTAILSRSGGFQGIGFAIPVNMAKKIMSDLIESGSVQRGWLGVQIQNVDASLAKGLKLPNRQGAIVSQIIPDSPAEKSDLKEGDVIVRLNGKSIKNVNELRNNVALLKAGSKVQFEVYRKGKKKTVVVTIGSRDGENYASGAKSIKSSTLGVNVEDINDNIRNQFNIAKSASGVVVTDIESGSRAQEAGLKVGDVISQINYRNIENVQDYKKAIEEAKKEKNAVILINREGFRMFTAIELN